MTTVFRGCHVVLDLTTSVSFKKKQEIRKKITENDGVVSYIVTKKSTHVVCNDPAKTDFSYKCKMAQKYGIPVVSISFLYDCVDKGRLLSSDDYLMVGKSTSQKLGSGKIAATKYQILGKRRKSYFYPAGVKAWPLQEKHTPIFNHTKYQVAKYAVLQKYVKSAGRTFFCVLEVHVTEECDLLPRQIHRFRVSKHHGNLKNIQEGKPEKMECYYVETSEEATKMYSFLYKQETDHPNLMEVSHDAPPRGVGTLNFQKVMVSFGLEKAELSTPVCELVEGIWKEAYSDLSDTLTSPSSVKLEQIEKAEALLMKLRGQPEDKQSVLDDYYSALPHNTKVSVSSVNNSWLSCEQDICQVMKDMLTVSEATGWSLRGSTESKYRALRCQIDHRGPDHHVYKTVKALINKSMEGNTRLNIINVFEVQRQMEEDNFTKELFGQNLLFHASKPNNFVGILSRGLLMPKVVVDDFGGKRTDAGMLGAGIYFASAASTSVKYSQVSKSRGTRMMLVNKVALGKCMDLYTNDKTLEHAPDGYSSVHGVASTSNKASDFTEDEYVVYSQNQQKMCYLVEFTIGSETPIPMEIVPTDNNVDTNTDSTTKMEKINLADVKDVLDPMTKVKSGLVADGKDINPVELTSVNVFGKLKDLVAEVKVLQHYHNNSEEMLEGKYVFPLDEMAAVCGFEAYINDKHVVGEVKEKETAHQEYKKAISEGHGAYLMDQDEESPDVFTVSVGNVPANADVVIKITYVTELQVEDDLVSFRLPGTLAPWKKSSQDSNDIECCVEVAVDMPFDIRSVHSPTHEIMIASIDDKGQVKKIKNGKPEQSTVLVVMEPNLNIGDGFQLLLELAEAHVPRMWVEQSEDDPTKQACMLTFYPEFEACEDNESEVILMLDLSNSMTDKGLNEAKKILLLILHFLPKTWKFNVVIFGTAFRELFPSSQPKNKSSVSTAEVLIQSVDANMGNTDLYRPLHSFYLLKPESALRNIFLVSDGHINNQDITLDTVHKNSQHTRVFTFGVSSMMNRHMLGALARVGAGVFEGFDSKAKSKWEEKVKSQIAKAGQPGLTSVAVSWQQEYGAPPPKQAPNQITAVFSGSRIVVYGFVQNCASATLTAEIGDQEISAVVTKSDRYVSKGKILHQLAAKAIIRDWEDGLLSSDGLNQQRMKMDMKDYIIRLSKEFSIVTQLTSFIAVEKRDKDEEVTSPDIDDLLMLEHTEICTYLGPHVVLDELWEVIAPDEESSNADSAEYSPDNEILEKKLFYPSSELDREVEEELALEMSCEVEDQYEVLDCYKAPVVQFSKDRILPIPSKSSELDREVEEELALEMSCEVEDQYEVLDCYKAPVVQFSKDRILPIPSKSSELDREVEEELALEMSCEVEDQYEVLDCYKAPVVQFSKDRILPIPSKSSELDREVEEELALEMSCEVEDQYEVLDCVQSEQYKAPVVQFSKDRILPIPSKVFMNSGKTSESESDQDTYFDSTIKYQQRNEDVIAKKTMSKMLVELAEESEESEEDMGFCLFDDTYCDVERYLSATPISPPPKSAKDFTSGPPIPPRQKSAMAFTPTAPPPPPPKSAMAFTSAAPPPPPPKSAMAFTSAAPPPPPPKSAVAFTSATPPPPPPKSAMAFTPATPIPPPPKSAKTFTSGPPIPPHRKSAMAFTPATPIPPPPKSALAFTPAAPPPPPPKTAMAFTPGTPPPPPPKSAVAFTSATSPPPPPPPPKSAMAFTPATPIPPPPKSAVAFTSATPPPPPPPHRKSAMAFTPATQRTRRARKSRLAFTPAAPPPPSPQHGRSSRQTSICNRFSGADECLLDRVSSPVTEGLSHCFGQSQQSARPLSSANRSGKSTEDLISLSVLDENKKFRKKKMSAVFKDESVDLPRRLRTAVARERPDLTDVRTFCMEDAGSKQTYGYGSTERSRGLHVDDDRFQKLRRRAGIETDILQDISDVGTIMPTVAKAALKNLSKKDLDTLKALQNRLGGWTRSQVEKELFIDLTACMETLNTAGLKSLGTKVAMEIENVLVAAFVVMWMLKTLVPELFPLNTKTRGWSDSVVNIAKGVLEIYDHDQSLLDKAISYCDQIERAHPGVASILELGPNWFAVALKMLGC